MAKTDVFPPVKRAQQNSWLGFTFVAWCCVSAALLFTQWDAVSLRQFADNDDYLRWVQFTQWLETPSWYLQPLPRFNPTDGQIIHWSRFPDLPLAAVTWLLSHLMDDAIAATLSISLIPLLYLLGLLFAIGHLTARMTDNHTASLAIVVTLLSPLLSPFVPSAIDHHGLQLCLLAWIIALTPFHREECRSSNPLRLQAILIALSLWVGLENIIAFLLLLLTLCIIGYRHQAFLYYCQRLCCYLLGLVPIAILLSRPWEDFLHTHNDQISIALVTLLACGWLFCTLSLWCFRRLEGNSLALPLRFLFLSLIAISPFLALHPTFLLGPYYQYPDLLAQFWLNHVSEAMPIIDYLYSKGVWISQNYLFVYAPALLACFWGLKTPQLKVVYGLMLVAMALPLFWQLRTIYTASLIVMPLYAYSCMQFLSHLPLQSRHAKFAASLLLTPLAILYLMQSLNKWTDGPSDPALRTSLSGTEKVQPLLDSNIHDALILAPVSYGTPILALTNNRILAAPYHRNVAGNLFVIRLLTSSNQEEAYQKLLKAEVDYLMFGSEDASRILLKQSPETALIHQLHTNQLPLWLTEIAHAHDHIRLLKFTPEKAQ
ncbi:hypothetical protein [Thaumasiovibrio subtropicus]|uniref:hypothetical protein n=1 Tax=Thaumasiovibrio subtropicus TaxID=1891207 RepID=UPI000B358B41|nr:hypothetical protein [Thaumasiovibrio subtropicus]